MKRRKKCSANHLSSTKLTNLHIIIHANYIKNIQFRGPLFLHSLWYICGSETVVQVHMCNKLASRHVRVGLADPIAVPRCDICENEPGMQFLFFWYNYTFSISTSFLPRINAHCQVSWGFTHTKVNPFNLASSVFLLRDRWKFSLFAMWYVDTCWK